jgi:hypothetical protein
MIPDQETLRRLLDYEPETGRLIWKARPHNRAWSTKYAGKEAFVSQHRGYRIGNLLGGSTIAAHRVIFKYVYGRDAEQVDHINGDPGDNRLCNLREVNYSENRRNSRKPSNNTSGVIGVSFCRRMGKWRAFTKLNGKYRHLGWFAEMADAVTARATAERENGFHPNHGREMAHA